MEKIATENLFLLEFLVDGVHLNPCALGEIADMPGETCVAIQFLDNAPLDICEDDFAPSGRTPGKVKSGKSCLFSLTPEQACEATCKFDIYINVVKKMEAGVLPDKMQIGNSLISIVNLFNELIGSVSDACGAPPAAKTLKDAFKLTNGCGQIVGEIDVYVRMSCFGKLIVTQFQMNLDDKSVLFKDQEGHSLYRYKKAGKGDANVNVNRASVSSKGGCPEWDRATKGRQPNPSCPEVPCQMGPPPAQQQMDTPCNECGVPPMQNNQGMQGMNMNAGPPPPPGPGCYQEIGAQMGGNALTIRVHKEQGNIEQCECADDDVADDESCTCTVGNVGKRKKKQRRSSGQPEACGPMVPQNYNMGPGGGCGPDQNPNSPFSFKLSGCGGATNQNVTVLPPTCTSPDAGQYAEPADPSKEVFILRIGKKSEGQDKKSNLELELCTPKGPELKPLPKKETRDTQYDPVDAGIDPKKKKEKGDGKGKGGKGGKGKKGKK